MNSTSWRRSLQTRHVYLLCFCGSHVAARQPSSQRTLSLKADRCLKFKCSCLPLLLRLHCLMTSTSLLPPKSPGGKASGKQPMRRRPSTSSSQVQRLGKCSLQLLCETAWDKVTSLRGSERGSCNKQRRLLDSSPALQPNFSRQLIRSQTSPQRIQQTTSL